MGKSRDLCIAILVLLSFAIPRATLAELPQWVANPKSDDTFFAYQVGYGAKATRRAARDAAFDDALNKIASSITERPREFDLKDVEVLEGCEHYAGFTPIIKCWVQVSFPIHERQEIISRIEYGEKLNRVWRQVQTHMNEGRFADCREQLSTIASKYAEGYYKEFSLNDVNLVIGDTYIGEDNPNAALTTYRDLLTISTMQNAAAQRILAVGDYYKKRSEISKAEKLYNEIIAIPRLKPEVIDSAVDRLIGLGDYYKSQGDYSLAYNYYTQVAENKAASYQKRNAARKHLAETPEPPRAWRLNETLGKGNVGILCVKRKGGKIMLFKDLTDALALDLKDARVNSFDVTTAGNISQKLSSRIFERLDFPAMQSYDGKDITHMIAILLDIDDQKYGSRLGAQVKALIYDYERKVLLNNVSFKERVADVAPNVQADHIVGVLVFRHLCPKDSPLPTVSVAPFEAKSGVGLSLSTVMTESFRAKMTMADKYRMIPDHKSSFYRKTVAPDRHNHEDYVEYGNSGSSFLINASVAKLGDTYHLTTQMNDLESETTFRQASTDFKSVSGVWLNYEMERHLSELLETKAPRRPKIWNRAENVIKGTYLNLPGDMFAIEEALNINLKKLETGSQNACEMQKKVAVSKDLPIQAKTRKSEIEMCLIPKGTLLTRSGTALDIFKQPVYVGKYEITQKQWKIVMTSRETPSLFAGDSRPVENMTWQEANRFCERLCALEGVETGTYRLPSTEEWEYICRAGTMSPYYTGESESDLKSAAWYENNVYNERTSEVGKLRCNAWGLHDTLGNVWEWTIKTRSSGRTKGIPQGGCWNSAPKECEASFSAPYFPPQANVIGFRILRDIDLKPDPSSE